MEHMKFESPDLVAGNVEKIAELFPNCVTETRGADGKLKKAINFEMLRQMLSADLVEGDEAYEFTWVGKKAAIVEANRPIRKTLRPCPKESVDWDTTENLYIEGDNLEVLKLLQESYLGKVKMIYIDPPYNTGNDFIYRDDFKVDSDEYEEQLGMFDEETGERLFKNTDSNGRFHSDWCSMIYPRLLIARNILREDGVIFVSIDDNEVHDLRKICDEVFGSSNFVGCAGRITKLANNKGDYWAPNFDYLLTYAKNLKECPSFFGGINYDSYNLIEESGPRKGERYQLVRLYMTSLGARPNQRYYIECPDGSYIIPPGSTYPAETKDGAFVLPEGEDDKCWRWSYQTYLEQKDRVVVKKTRTSNVVGEKGASTCWNAFTKTYLNDVIDNLSATPNNFIQDHINQKASHELKKLNIPFDYAKPTSLIKYLAETCRVNDDDIVMDFFSGSASSADALIQFNVNHKKHAHFIMVQLPEITDENSLAKKAGFHTICEIGKERIRRAGCKIKEESPLTTQDLDIGFRVLKLDSTNMEDVRFSADEYGQEMLEHMVSNIKPDRTDLDLLFGCLLEWGLPLSLPYTSEELDGCTVHTYNDGDLIACFNEDIPESVIKAIAKRQPLRAVFRDSSFASSPAKINVEEIFKMLAPDTRVKVI